MMSGVGKEISSDGGARKILLIGDVSRAFLDMGAAREKRFEVCTSLPDAIDAAAQNRFAAIAVVISANTAKLSSTLKSLRDRCDVKIVLLAQMYEEPIAIQLVNSAYDGTSLANDYFICPVEPDILYESLTAAAPHITDASLPAVQTTETRIRYLERLATEDDLTGLKNRRYIREFARQIVERAGKGNGRVTILVFDIDDFKHYNDVYGHRTGDEILRQAAALMRRCCRGHDVVGRIGGDEFAVVFWDDPQQKWLGAPPKPTERRSAFADHPTQAVPIARRFVKELEKAELSSLGVLGPEGKGMLTISGGLASFPRDGRTSEELFLQADKALLEAKRSGKNRIYLVGKPDSDITDIE
jgi:PleD family two-component response regulator